jgi:hypothetical protein
MNVTDDMVDIISPVFSSIDFSSGNVDLSSTLSVKVVVENEYGVTETTKATQATLVCDDGDIFNMYVKLVPEELIDSSTTTTSTASALDGLTDEQLIALLSAYTT